MYLLGGWSPPRICIEVLSTQFSTKLWNIDHNECRWYIFSNLFCVITGLEVNKIRHVRGRVERGDKLIFWFNFKFWWKYFLKVAVPISETQFVEEIHGSGVLVYVSATWLCELYQSVLAKSLLLSAGYDLKSNNQPALINLLTGKYFCLELMKRFYNYKWTNRFLLLWCLAILLGILLYNNSKSSVIRDEQRYSPPIVFFVFHKGSNLVQMFFCWNLW